MSVTSARSDSFDYEGHRIAYDEYGSGDRVLVLTHGLLMNSRMYERLGPAIAERGNRVICLNVLGHGPSDAPEELGYYSMSAFADQTEALLDHIGVGQAVIGGTSLGSNVALEFAVRHPTRARALFMEMPVLENALVAVAVIFTPIMLALQVGGPVLRAMAGLARQVPRTHYLVDIALDWARRDPERSANVLRGLLLGRSAPIAEQRRKIEQPTLIVGHPSDPLHPFADSDQLAEELPNGRLFDASSIMEWRTHPERLNAELCEFLDEVWGEGAARLRDTG
jgi:pimeloyl-ACP methyl ester carboxylesterase